MPEAGPYRSSLRLSVLEELQTADAGGRDLGGDAGSHDAIVVDAQAVPGTVAAGIGGIDLDLLIVALIGDQQGIRPDLQNTGSHRGVSRTAARATTAARAGSVAGAITGAVPAATTATRTGTGTITITVTTAAAAPAAAATGITAAGTIPIAVRSGITHEQKLSSQNFGPMTVYVERRRRVTAAISSGCHLEFLAPAVIPNLIFHKDGDPYPIYLSGPALIAKLTPIVLFFHRP